MLERVRIRNFRSIRELDWQPEKLNVLVGPNNSGKTNLCYALAFLAATVRLDVLDEAATETCGAPGEVACRLSDSSVIEFEIVASLPSDQDDVRFRYRLLLEAVGPSPDANHVLEVREEELRLEDAPSWPLLKRSGNEVQLFNEGRAVESAAPNDGPDHIITTTAPSRQTMLSRLYEYKGNPPATMFKRFVRNFRYYSIYPSELRRQARITEEPVLDSRGTNLASVLYTLKNEDERTYRAILDLVREVEPRLEYFNFIRLADNTVVAEAVIGDADDSVTLSAMSDGTLRYLALSTVVLQAQARTRREVEWPTVVLYEEPENGLYARHLGKLAERLGDLAQNTQTVVTTHSPFLLDYFGERLDSVFVVTRPDEPTGTVILSPDADKTRAMLEHTSMGEMLFSEVLACE